MEEGRRKAVDDDDKEGAIRRDRSCLENEIGGKEVELRILGL